MQVSIFLKYASC